MPNLNHYYIFLTADLQKMETVYGEIFVDGGALKIINEKGIIIKAYAPGAWHCVEIKE